MAFPVSSGLLDAMVLSVVEKEDSYGYKITQQLCTAVSVSESTLYPVLRRLQKNGMLNTYDREFQGRNRRYYKITPNGRSTLEQYRKEWLVYRNNIENIILTEGD